MTIVIKGDTYSMIETPTDKIGAVKMHKIRPKDERRLRHTMEDLASAGDAAEMHPELCKNCEHYSNNLGSGGWVDCDLDWDMCHVECPVRSVIMNSIALKQRATYEIIESVDDDFYDDMDMYEGDFFDFDGWMWRPVEEKNMI